MNKVDNRTNIWVLTILKSKVKSQKFNAKVKGVLGGTTRMFERSDVF